MKFILHYPKSKTELPILSSLILDTGAKINVLRAQIDGIRDEVMIEVEDDKAELSENYLKNAGLEVFRLEKGITLDDDKCIDCGACISICPTAALFMGENYKVELDESKCILCETCIAACPMRAISSKEGNKMLDNSMYQV